MNGNNKFSRENVMGSYVNPQPFTCYFCKKYIQKETETGHLSICSSVLEPCSNKCGLYVTRTMKEKHLKDCKNQKPKNMPRVTFQESNMPNYQPSSSNMVSNGTATLGRRRLASNSSNESQINQNKDIMEFRQNLQNLNQQMQLLTYNLENIKLKCKEENQSLQRSSMQIQMNYEKIQYQNQVLLDWKRNIDMQLENFKDESNRNTHFRIDQENQLLNMQNKLLILDKVSNDQKNYADAFLREQIGTRETTNDLKAQINELRDFSMQENATISAVWNEHHINIEKLQQDTETIKKNLDEYKAKYNALVFDTRAVTQISAETSEKLEIQEKTVSDIKKNVCQLRADFEALESRVYGEMVATKAGRLLWKVPDFSSKFQDAKDSDIVLKSPVFYSHEYGYKLRLIVFLNGLKKWKGRHMLATLQVLKGEYDDLLKWPCSIEGTVTIRDVQDNSNPKSFSKVISAKRQYGNEESEDPHESSNQYIFIPHSNLFKDCFVKNDSLYLDIKIKKSILLINESDF